MLQGLMGKVMAGLLSVSSLMFSSYTGNDPGLTLLQSRAGQNYLIIRAALDNAFENDFSEVFRCGKPVNIWFRVVIRDGNRNAFARNYCHTVTYDPMNASWELNTSENDVKTIHTDYQAMLDDVAELECSIPRNSSWNSVELRLEAWLQSIELTQPNRTVNLMMLWKYKRPTFKTVLVLPQTG
jgi:hypothetical protein